MTRRSLSFEQTIARQLVHRASLGEVYIADSLQLDEREFVLAVQIPRAHCVWFDRTVPFHDPLSTAEAARQGVYVVVHRHLGLPAGLAFSLQRLAFSVTHLEGYRDRGTGPLEGVLALRLVDRSDTGMAFEGELTVEDAVVVTVAGDLVLLPSDDYAALREHQRRRNPPAPPPAAGPPLEPAAVGRRDPRNCVLAPPTTADGPARYPLLIDEKHPSFFEHRYDHVPGPLIVEAYRQAALVSAHAKGLLAEPVAAVTGCEVTFTRFAELDALVECSAAVDRGGEHLTVDVQLVQFDTVVSTGRVQLQSFPADG